MLGGVPALVGIAVQPPLFAHVDIGINVDTKIEQAANLFVVKQKQTLQKQDVRRFDRDDPALPFAMIERVFGLGDGRAAQEPGEIVVKAVKMKRGRKIEV